MSEAESKNRLYARLTPTDIGTKMKELDDGWRVADGRRIERLFTFADFATTMTFVNRVAELADEQDHHPQMIVNHGSLEISIHTHITGHLSMADFTLATAIDAIDFTDPNRVESHRVPKG